MRRAFLLALAVAVSAAPVYPGLADARVLDRLTTSTGRPFAVPGLVEEIPNFAEIQPGVARGGQPTDEGIRLLRDRGYRTVISFRSDSPDRDEVLRSGMGYVEIPLHAGIFGATDPTEEQVRHFLSVVTDPAKRPVFIHCLRGKDRTGVMSAIYRIEACGWTADEAIEEMRAFGFHGYYRGFVRFVRSYSRRASYGSPFSFE
jgi:tyrosine-protein phosphatase SIW14